MVNLCPTGVVVEVAMVVGTGAETITGTMQVLVQIDIIMGEIVRVHIERTSALSILCTKNYDLRGLINVDSPGLFFNRILKR